MARSESRSDAEIKLLVTLADAHELKDAHSVVAQLEKRFGYRWLAVGGRESNYGLINIGSDPGDALIERVTNAIDAVIDREALRAEKKRGGRHDPSTPREAVDAWFEVPGGRIANIASSEERQRLADHVVIELLDGTSKSSPGIAIRDFGTGLTARQVPRTILSLGEGNKLDKLYLAGAYGQGGSTTLAFSPAGTIIVTRRQKDLLPSDEKDHVSVTIAKYEDLDPEINKNGRYSYLVDREGMIGDIPAAQFKHFQAGTLVRHLSYEMARYSQQLTQPKGSLWWLLQNVLFDPVLPFWAVDSRSWVVIKNDGKPLRRTIAGNNTRLTQGDSERIEYRGTVDVNLQHPGGETSVKVNYWVVKPRSEGDTTAPIDAYVDPFEPVNYTFNGQRHGTDDRRFVKDRLQLSYLAKYLIVQVELDHLHARARRDVLSSTRDRLKQVPFFEQIREGIVAGMTEDDDLIRLNDERKEDLLRKHSQKDRDRLKQRFAELMSRLAPGVDARTDGGGRESGGRPPSGSRSREELKPLATKKRPTYIRIANTKLPVPVQLERHALIRIESDAPDGYLDKHIHARMIIATQPEKALILESKSDFKGGRSRLTVKVAEGTKEGCDGTLTVFLFTPEGDSLSDSAKFRVEGAKSKETSGRERQSEVKVPEPIPVTRDQWDKFSWNEMSVAEVHPGQDPKIFVNVDNRHLDALLRSGGYLETGLSRMKDNFLLYVAFFAWSRHTQMVSTGTGLSGEDFEKYQAAELDRLAQTVVYSISANARLAAEEQ